ncbi:DUF2726 domain-containing protein [Deinococcus sp. KSM4-11]|uniref:DUF2726 domain-containing protein n=1 Tax=Deinococcus sp. KSM4-11 TaxID=2568654 RepID=UPI0010A3ECDA|nr:DUF2726 domain-containing protein [Deinococcus sp. KSM4-11]THF87169.1 DUF2726 domain-containing protein [Deinococcus sp. KSM4-11]
MPRRHVLLVDDHKTDVILAQAALELSALDAQVTVRLNDIFYSATRHPGQQRAAYARLRDKHVDFLVVALPELRPVLALELDGDSHDNDAQRYRDAVKDVAFASAGLPLIRARAETVWTPEAIRSHIEGSMARR